ncbi:MAG: hypothetical protein HUJ68_06895 [Clostridia bacterium]|nr:hypothetical protein [Clostridia bacterium]
MVEYPEFAEIDGELYKINTDYIYALECFKIIDDNSISDVERAIAVVSVLFGQENEKGEIINIPKNINGALEKAAIFLSCGKENKSITDAKKDMDFEYDKEFIYASFISDYKIDLENTNMHFWKFCNLISGLTEDSILNRVRDLRNTNLSDYTDPKTRTRIQEAMDRVALPTQYDKEDLEALENFNKLLGDD